MEINSPEFVQFVTDKTKANLYDLEKGMLDGISAKFRDHITQQDRIIGTVVGDGCITEVASDRGALVEALAEYGFRQVFECKDGDWGYELAKLDTEVRSKVKKMIADEIRQKQGYRPPEEG